MSALLKSVVRLADVRSVTGALIDRFGNFAAILAAPTFELRKTEGLGEAGATALKVVHAAAVRMLRVEAIGPQGTLNWDRLISYLYADLGRERVEHLRVLFLDSDEHLLTEEAFGRGTVDHVPVYPREIVKRALEVGAAELVLVHNHPCGNAAPSLEDMDTTMAVREAACVVGLALRDHLIIGNGCTYSFRRMGFL